MNRRSLIIDAKNAYLRGKLAFIRGKLKLEKDRNDYAVYFQTGAYEVVDTWNIVPNSDFSSGKTVISCRDHIHSFDVWEMHYGGWCAKEAALFLQKALANAYGKREFYGGRGCRFFHPGSKQSFYENRCEGDFEQFLGQEKIYNKDGKILSRYCYFGHLLV